MSDGGLPRNVGCAERLFVEKAHKYEGHSWGLHPKPATA